MTTATTTTLMQIDPELRSKWLEALRSDEYEGREYHTGLVDSYYYATQSFCALGLGAHVSGQVINSEDAENAAYEFLEERGVDPGTVWRVFDHDRMTFKQFADWLEANSEPAA